MKLASWSVCPLVDAVPAPVETSWSFPAVPPEAWAEVEGSGLDPAGRFQPNLGCFLLQSAGRTVLCDAGIGPGPNAYLGGLRGALPERLSEAGVSAEKVDAVFFTHLHMDHVGWAVRRLEDGRFEPTFPNAEYVVNEAEYRFWAADPQSAGSHHREAFRASIEPLARAGRLTLVQPSREILPGVSLLETPGHTPGHCSIVFEDAHSSIVATGDVFHCPAQIARPDFSHRADQDAELARTTRRGFIEQAARAGWLIACGHFRDGLQIGRIERDRGAARYVPAA